MQKIEIFQCIDILNSSLEALKDSLNRCRTINLEKLENWDDKNDLEALSSRFSRTSDIYIQKLLKFVILSLKEEDKYVIDRINKSEKIGLIYSANTILEIRDLRNEIAHEYRPDSIEILYSDILKYSLILIENIELTYTFIYSKPDIFH